MSDNIDQNDLVVDEVVEVEQEQETVEEETTAQASLNPSNTTKSSMLAQMMKYVAGMKKEDLSAFLTKTLAQVGKEADNLPDWSKKNQASIAMKPGKTPAPSAKTGAVSAVKEDVEELLGDQDLSEEFKEKTATLFEAAVNNRFIIESEKLREEYEQNVQEEVEKQVMESIDELHEQVEKYLDYVAKTWMEQNEVALEQNIRTAITENFIEGLANLFKESYVDIPEDKIDYVEEVTQELEAAKADLEESVKRTVELEKQLKESSRDKVFAKVAEGLVATQSEKLKSLSESLETDDLEDYENKLTIIRDQYFNEEQDVKTSTGLINEDSVGSNDEPEDEVKVAPEMRNYVSAISSTIKK